MRKQKRRKKHSFDSMGKSSDIIDLFIKVEQQIFVFHSKSLIKFSKQNSFHFLNNIPIHILLIKMPVFYPKKKSKPPKDFYAEGSKAKTLKNFQSNQTFMKTFRHSLVQHCRKNYLASAFNKRRNKLLHITQENKKIYDRINSQKTFYSTKKINKSYEQSQKSSKSTSRFRKGKCQKLSSSTSTQKQDLGPRVTKKQRMYKLQVENIDNLRKQELQKFNRIFKNDKGGQVKYVQKRKQHLNKNYCTFQLKCPLGQIKNTLKCLTATNSSGAKNKRYDFQHVRDEEKPRRMQFLKI